jgi:multimeric flavodoxin WrbA
MSVVYDPSSKAGQKIFEEVEEISRSLGVPLLPVEALDGRFRPCAGCFSCWVKTPGVCIYKKDGGPGLVRSLANSNLILVISRIQWGTYETSVKTAVDRMIPILHPYFIRFNGELHHRRRYPQRPKLLVVGFGALTREEEQTFIGYTESHRNNLGWRRSRSTFILKEDSPSDALKAWLSQEVTQ